MPIDFGYYMYFIYISKFENREIFPFFFLTKQRLLKRPYMGGVVHQTKKMFTNFPLVKLIHCMNIVGWNSSKWSHVKMGGLEILLASYQDLESDLLGTSYNCSQNFISCTCVFMVGLFAFAKHLDSLPAGF